MKALILSGGLGTRLRPLTDKIPKTMVEISGKPLLWYHVIHLQKHGIKDIWMALHYLPDTIKNYFGNGSNFDAKIHYSFAKKDLGTAGALKNIKNEFENETFLVVYGDNLTNFNYSKLIRFHKKKNSILTIGLYKADEPWTMGVIETKNTGEVRSFIEKPAREGLKSTTVSAGVMVCEPEIIKHIPSGFSDFAYDIIPVILKSKKGLFALDTGSYVQDCGTIKRLTRARIDYKNGRVRI